MRRNPLSSRFSGALVSRMGRRFREATLRTLALLLLLVCHPPLAAQPEASVVHITTFSQRPLWNEPWRFDYVRKSTGTGFVIAGQRIMTNAHVVSWAKEILVQRYQSSRPYVAHVKFIGHDSDLAILAVDDPEFFQGMQPLRFGGLPRVRSSVTTVGYPAGGDQISYTRGVVSRIESRLYAHSGVRSFLAVQTDAALNPGNSGGPVMQDDRVVGVAFQNLSALENAGFFIPTPVVEHFLEDVADGQHDGFPDAGLALSGLENEAYRRYLRLPPELDGLGARVDEILPIATTEALVQVDDVILSVDGYPVGSDATVLYEGNRVHVGILIDTAQAGETLRLDVFRDGQSVAVELPVHIYSADWAEGNQYDRLPRYFVYAGLVFLPLSANYLATIDDDHGAVEQPHLYYALNHHGYEHPHGRREETIVLAHVLPHAVNADVQFRGRYIVDRINGIRVERIEDVIRAFDSAAGSHDLIEFLDGKYVEALDRQAAQAAGPEILRSYGLVSDRRL